MIGWVHRAPVSASYPGPSGVVPANPVRSPSGGSAETLVLIALILQVIGAAILIVGLGVLFGFSILRPFRFAALAVTVAVSIAVVALVFLYCAYEFSYRHIQRGEYLPSEDADAGDRDPFTVRRGHPGYLLLGRLRQAGRRDPRTAGIRRWIRARPPHPFPGDAAYGLSGMREGVPRGAVSLLPGLREEAGRVSPASRHLHLGRDRAAWGRLVPPGSSSASRRIERGMDRSPASVRHPGEPGAGPAPGPPDLTPTPPRPAGAHFPEGGGPSVRSRPAGGFPRSAATTVGVRTGTLSRDVARGAGRSPPRRSRSPPR